MTESVNTSVRVPKSSTLRSVYQHHVSAVDMLSGFSSDVSAQIRNHEFSAEMIRRAAEECFCMDVLYAEEDINRLSQLVSFIAIVDKSKEEIAIEAKLGLLVWALKNCKRL